MKKADLIENIVIGGSGFIGSALCKALRDNGESVLSVANSMNGEMRDIKQVVCDISDKAELKKHLKGGKNVYILVGQVHRDFTVEKEIEGFENILLSIDTESTKKVFYFSSALIYGNTKKAAKEDSVVNPIDEYGRFKLKCENLILNKLDKDIISVIMRLSNVYGNVKNKGFIGLVFKNVFENSDQEIRINGDGKQSRDYIFLDDVISAILAIKNDNKDSDIINISTGENHDLVWLANKIAAISEKEIKYSITGDNFDSIENNIVSNDKLKSVYNFFPKYDLEKGLELTFEKYKEVYE